MHQMKSPILFAGIALLALAGCGDKRKPNTSANGDPSNTNPDNSVQRWFDPRVGTHEHELELQGGQTLRYTIMVPDSISDDKPTPLVVALHFGGTITPYIGRGMIDGMLVYPNDLLGAIVIAPDSLEGDWTNPDNEIAILELMAHVGTEYNIDEDRTLLLGFSMGGSGTWHLAARNQDRFSAAMPIAGRPEIDADTEWKIPLYVIHSEKDDVVPLGPTQKYVEQLKEKGADVELKIVKDLTHYDMPQYARHVKDAIPWIRKAWKQEP